MPIKERDIVLQGRDGGEDTIDLPITRLGNIESGAEVKQEPAQGDYIPVIDAGDNEQMKKVPAQWLREKATGAGQGTGELDLERSRICGEALSAYIPEEGEEALTGESGVVELMVETGRKAFAQDEAGNWFLNGVELWIKGDESGRRWGSVQVEGVEQCWLGWTADGSAPESRRVPVTVTKDKVKQTVPLAQNTVNALRRSAVVKVTVFREDGTAGQRYAVRVRATGDDTALEYVKVSGYGGMYNRGELQYREDGETPMTLSLEEAMERYGEMERIVSRHDPCLSWEMTEIEKGYYFHNGDPATGKPIQRKVYRVRMGRTELSQEITVQVRFASSCTVASIYLLGSSQVKSTKVGIKQQVSYKIGAEKENAASPTKGVLAVQGTGDWDKVCGRIYFQVEAGGNEREYMVLEIYNAEDSGNRRLGRLELDEDGLPMVEEPGENGFQLTHVRLKSPGSPVDPERDRFALWIREYPPQTQEYIGWGWMPEEVMVPTSAYLAGDWSQEAAAPGEDVSPERPAPARLRAWVSAENEKPIVVARAEDPSAWVMMGRDISEQTASYHQQSWDMTEFYPKSEIGPGEKLAAAYIHICTRDEMANRSGKPLTEYGRLYELDLFRAWPERELARAELMAEDGTTVLESAVPETVEGEEKLSLTAAGERVWIRLSCGALSGETEAPEEGKPRIYLFRKDADGNFTEKMTYGIRSCPEKPEGGADLEGWGWEQHGICWTRLTVPVYGAEYRVVVTDATGLPDSKAKRYTLSLTRAQEVADETQ